MFQESDGSDTESEDSVSSNEQNEFFDIEDIQEIVGDLDDTDMDWQYADEPFQLEEENVEDSQSRNVVKYVYWRT